MPSRTLPNPDHRNHLTRRRALQGTVAVGALALPAGAALAATEATGFYERFVQACKDRPELMRRFAGLHETAGADPLIELWAERQQAKAAADAGEDGPDEDELVDRQCRIEGRIARATPVSPEGAAIIATLLAEWFEDDVRHSRLEGRDSAPADQVGGATMARYILATTPAAVLQRAGLEVSA